MIDAKGEVIEEKAYYPFGLQIQDLAFHRKMDGIPYEFTFGGKEEWNSLGLGLLDFGARGYDAELGRWHIPDPLQEKFYDWSGYTITLLIIL